jgi:hypothetical protein
MEALVSAIISGLVFHSIVWPPFIVIFRFVLDNRRQALIARHVAMAGYCGDGNIEGLDPVTTAERPPRKCFPNGSCVASTSQSRLPLTEHPATN